MPFYFIDTAAAALLMFPLIGFIIVCGFMEGLIIYLFKIRKYWPAVAIALLINVASLIAGFILMPSLKYYDADAGSLIEFLLITYAVTIVIEGLLLKVLNQSKSWKSIIGATLVMNLITYLILFVIIEAL